MAQEPASPVSLLLSRLGMTRDDLSRHSDQMRQYLASENSITAPGPATPAPVPQPPASTVSRGAKRPRADDDETNPPQPSTSAHRPAPPRDDALPLPLTPASARHYRANVYDQLAGTSRAYGVPGSGPSPATSASASSARRPLVFASSSSPYYRSSPAPTPPHSSSPYIPTTSRQHHQALPIPPAPPQLPFVLPPGPYSPHKPDAPYAALIGRAILASPHHRLTLQEIYDFITTVYPFFTRHEQTWQNSIRHVLSTTVVFRKVQRERAAGRTLWAIWDEDVGAFEGGGFRKERVREMREQMAKKGGGKRKESVKEEVHEVKGRGQPSFKAPALKITPNSSGRKSKRARKDEDPSPAPSRAAPMASLEDDRASSRAPSTSAFTSYAQSSRAPSVATTDYDLPPPSSVYASSEYSRVPPSSASFAETRSSRYPSEAVSEHDAYLASRAAYEARFRDDDEDEEEDQGGGGQGEEVEMGVPLDQINVQTVKVEEPEADDSFAAQRRAYEARFQDEDAGPEPEPAPVAVDDAAAASRAAYEARFADDDDEEPQAADLPEPPQRNISPSPAPSRIEIDYAGRPGHLSDDPDDYLSYPEEDDDASPQKGDEDSSPPSLIQPGSSVSASSLGVNTPPSAATSSSALGESALRYNLRRSQGKAKDKDSLPSPPRPIQVDVHARKRARYDAYLSSPQGPKVVESFDVDMDLLSDDEREKEEEEEMVKRRGRGRAKARARNKVKPKTAQQTKPVQAPPAPRAPESPTIQRGRPARPLTHRRFSTPPRARTASPSPPPASTLPPKSKSFAALATPATPQPIASSSGVLPHPPAFAGSSLHATPGRAPLYPRPSSAFAHPTPGSSLNTDNAAPMRFSTLPPLSRTQHAVSAERTPLSYEGVHMSPSPSLAHFKTHLFPPPSFPPASGSSNAAGAGSGTTGGTFVAPQSTPIRTKGDKDKDKDSKAPGVGVFATPLTPRRLAFPSSSSAQSPFRTPGLFNALFDPHDPGAALDEELKRMDARAGAIDGVEGTPSGSTSGMGFARGMLYASPLGGFGGYESPAGGRWRYG